MPEDLHNFIFFSKNFDRASGTLVPFLSKSQVSQVSVSQPSMFRGSDAQWNENSR
ncbi:hypothetical protein XBJ1_2388 [Xenorhabdus bovienii SS-2004]|uniref:Uncharacterized protein n=1 Tax=Xenorhabdus bovienii (strain SS-2004) TaxID=406818 RepID=D3V1H0_XENBS|nr:hypothetical protein XBJ1_2388 [Xenorhabdus bovienii SS-2004]